MNQPQQKKTFSTRAKAVGGTVLLGGAVVAYYLLFGGLLGGKDFTGQDLRDQGDRFHSQDMVKAIFVDANISGLDMVHTQLQESNMQGVIAEGTDLYQAAFIRANLRNANFRGARLLEANFRNADLTGANLVGADIRGANFENAILDQADFRNTRTGPSCVERSTTTEHCTAMGGAEACCEQRWNQAHIDGLKVCRNPFATLLRRHADAMEGFGMTGEPVYYEQDYSEGGETYCTRGLWEGPEGGEFQDRQFDQGRGGLLDF